MTFTRLVGVIALVAGLAMSSTALAQTATIDFNTACCGNPYTEDDFRLSGASGSFSQNVGNPGVFGPQGSWTVTVTHTTPGTTFTVASLQAITFNQGISNGSVTVTPPSGPAQTINVINQLGLRTLNLNAANFSNITSFTISGQSNDAAPFNRIGVDNIQINSIVLGPSGGPTPPPIVAQVTPVSSPTNDSTPSYTFSTTKAGTLTVGGSCGSASEGAVSAGIVTISLTEPNNVTPLTSGTYSNCSITVTDASGNASAPLAISAFIVDTMAPMLAEVTAVTTPDNDTTPDVTFSTSEAGTLVVGGSCGSGNEGAIGSGNQNITLTQPNNISALAAGTYSDCTITVTDATGNSSAPLTLTAFTIDLTAPTVSELTPVTTPTNDRTPDVTFSTNEAGTLAVGGSCGSGDEGAIGSGNQTITLTQADNSTPLADGTFNDCTVTVIDVAGNANTPLTLTSFTIDAMAPTVVELTAVTTPANDSTPDVTFNTGATLEDVKEAHGHLVILPQCSNF
ncbi:MAG: hypothetical protein AAGE01_14540, partial [Pseudomonadota bacterium]